MIVVSDPFSAKKKQGLSNWPVFADHARFFDLLYRYRGFATMTGYVASLIKTFHLSASSVLELGSETGKHTRLLTDSVFRSHGIERSPDMLAWAS